MVAIRNVDVDPDAPIATWPYEALVTLTERGSITDWAILARAIDRQPWGIVARQVEEYLAYSRPYGVAPLLERAIHQARAVAEADEHAQVAAEIAGLVAESGLTLSDLASRLGTSGSRLSTYRSGRVVPSATFMVRLRRCVAQITGTSDA